MWYEKFKKILKVVAICLLLAAGVASYVLHIVFPDQTRLVIEDIKEFADRPLPIIGFGIGTLAAALLLILSKTSWGRKGVRAAKKECETVKAEFAQFKEESEKAIEEIKSFYEEKLALVEYNRNQERELIIDALSSIHNVGVQHSLEKYKSLVSYEGVSEVVDAEKEKLRQEYEFKFEAFTQALIADYEKKIAELGTKTTQEPTEKDVVIEEPIEEEKVAE